MKELRKSNACQTHPNCLRLMCSNRSQGHLPCQCHLLRSSWAICNTTRTAGPRPPWNRSTVPKPWSSEGFKAPRHARPVHGALFQRIQKRFYGVCEKDHEALPGGVLGFSPARGVCRCSAPMVPVSSEGCSRLLPSEVSPCAHQEMILYIHLIELQGPRYYCEIKAFQHTQRKSSQTSQRGPSRMR